MPEFFAPDDVLGALRWYGCRELARTSHWIVVISAENKATALSIEIRGIRLGMLAGALAVLGIDLTEFLARLDALTRGNGPQS